MSLRSRFYLKKNYMPTLINQYLSLHPLRFKNKGFLLVVSLWLTPRSNQFSISSESKASQSDYVLLGSGSPDFLERQVNRLHEALDDQQV